MRNGEDSAYALHTSNQIAAIRLDLFSSLFTSPRQSGGFELSLDETVKRLEIKANRLRIHSLLSTSEAGSGHPTSCLSSADIVAALFFHIMRYNPNEPSSSQNDRFVLSKGHAAPLLYAAWAEAGAFPVEKLSTLRRFDSDLEGHPTTRFKWVDVATGSLGQGLSIGLGIAYCGKYLDRLGYRVYVLLGDGESAEGAVWEAAALAAYYKLDNLVGIVDANALGQSQRTMYGHDIESYRRRFEAFGWHAICIDGHDMREILGAFEEASNLKDRPVAIIAKTIKGKGVSFLEGKEGWHGRALKKGEELERALDELQNADRGELKSEISSPSTTSDPQLTSYELGEEVATRQAYGIALARLGDVNPFVISLDGDVKNSTFAETFMHAHPERYFEGFIAEQDMVGVAMGLSSRGRIPFVSTFSAFLSRAYDQIRMSAISGANIKYVGSHCGVSIGEDGPSQMGLEDLALFRAIPHSVVLYPCDAVSTEKLVFEAAKHKGIVYIRTTRPKTPVIYRSEEKFRIGGCKILRQSERDKVTVVAAGVTLYEAMKAYEILKTEQVFIRVIDAYCVKPLDEKTLIEAASETNNSIVAVEDHYYEGGLGDAVLSTVATTGIHVYKMGIREVPRSGKPEELMSAYGISAERIAEKARGLFHV